MSTQEFTPKKPQIEKSLLIAAIAVSSLALLLLFLVDEYLLAQRLAGKAAILYLLLSCAAAIFYLIRKEQAAAARVWGILGGFALILLPPSFITIPPFAMGIGGGALALRRPKLAGALMLVGAIRGVKGLMLLFAPSILNGPTGLYAFPETIPFLLSISFLIPGGILALTSRKGQGASKKMVIGTIAALFALFLWPVLYLIPYYFLK